MWAKPTSNRRFSRYLNEPEPADFEKQSAEHGFRLDITTGVTISMRHLCKRLLAVGFVVLAAPLMIAYWFHSQLLGKLERDRWLVPIAGTCAWSVW